MSYSCLKGRLTDTRLRWRGVGRPGSEGEHVPFSKDDVSYQPALKLSGTELSKAREEAWPFVAGGPRTDRAAFDLEADISHYDDAQKKSMIGDTQAVELRLSFEAVDEFGRPVYRIINERVYLEVTTFWRFCWPMILFASICLGIVVLVAGTIFFFNRWISPAAEQAADPAAAGMEIHDDEDGIMVPEGQDGFDSALRGAQAPDEPSPESPDPSVPAATTADFNYLPEGGGNFDVDDQPDVGNLLPPE